MRGERVPMLVKFLYGEEAGPERGSENPRLGLWAAAFDEWLRELSERYKPSTPQVARLAWGRLLRQVQKSPWELEQGDVERHMQWMQAAGYSYSTINLSVGMVARFYRWCAEQEVDPECPGEFNPARGVKRCRKRTYGEVKILSEDEMRRLLRVMQQDVSPLGKRDYAFVLARLSLGVPTKSLLGLKWEQMEVEAGGAWVVWRAGGERERLEAGVWEAIQAYLQASGRLESMTEGKYVFCPASLRVSDVRRDRAEAWEEGRSASTISMLNSLRLYGGLAGIAEEKLTLNNLRWTAVRLRMDGGCSIEELQVFLDSQDEKRGVKYRMGKLPPMPEGTQEAELNGEVVIPKRTPNRFQLGNPGNTSIVHGMFAQTQPPEEVLEVLREGDKGVDEEIACLRTLGRTLMHWQEQAASRVEMISLMGAYSRVAHWMGEMIRIEQQTKDEKEDALEGGPQKSIMQVWVEKGIATSIEEIRNDALRGEGEKEQSTRRVAEEIASTRLVLRRVFSLASNAQDAAELVRLADLYGVSCVRLMKLMRLAGSEDELVEDFLMGKVLEALDDMWESKGESPRERPPRKFRRPKRRRR